MVFNGGHSGKDIGANRGNPIITLGTILSQLNNIRTIYLNSIKGGTWVTSIPREAECIITTDTLDYNKLKELLIKFNEDLRLKYNNDNISLELEQLTNQTLAFDSQISNRVIRYISKFPDGQILKNENNNDTIFSANLGTIFMENDHLFIENSIRSNINSETTKQIIERLKKNETSKGFNTVETYDFPGYVQNTNSEFIEFLVKKHIETFGSNPKLKEEHFLLECAWFGEKNPNLQYVSISPNIENPHSPYEKVSIPSIKGIWQYVKGIVKDLDKNYEKENVSKEDDELSI